MSEQDHVLEEPAPETFSEYRKKLQEKPADGEKSKTQELLDEIQSARRLTADDFNIVVGGPWRI